MLRGSMFTPWDCIGRSVGVASGVVGIYRTWIYMECLGHYRKESNAQKDSDFDGFMTGPGPSW